MIINGNDPAFKFTIQGAKVDVANTTPIRIQIATEIMAGIAANPNVLVHRDQLKSIADTALMLADTLIQRHNQSVGS